MKTALCLIGLLLIHEPFREGIDFRHDCEKIVLQDNQVFIEARIGGNPSLVSLDFGQPDSMIKEATCEAKALQISNRLISGRKRFPAFNADNNCFSTDAIFGYDIFRKSQQVFHLDFDSQTLCCLTAADAKKLATRYEEVKSSFKSDGIYISVSIRRKNYELKLNTGYPGTVSMNRADAEPFLKEAHQSYETLDGDRWVYPNKWITFGGNYYNSAITVTGSKTSSLGAGFIKGFNWVIDFRERKVYIKKSSVSLDAENDFRSEYSAKVKNGKLVITSKKANARDFTLGSVITKVNGKEVSMENLCETEAFLKTAQWNALDIRVE